MTNSKRHSARSRGSDSPGQKRNTEYVPDQLDPAPRRNSQTGALRRSDRTTSFVILHILWATTGRASATTGVCRTGRVIAGPIPESIRKLGCGDRPRPSRRTSGVAVRRMAVPGFDVFDPIALRTVEHTRLALRFGNHGSPARRDHRPSSNESAERRGFPSSRSLVFGTPTPASCRPCNLGKGTFSFCTSDEYWFGGRRRCRPGRKP